MSSKACVREWVNIVLLGLIEGITEFLPVSSTGHLLIAEPWLGGSRGDLFNSVIQSGAVLAVLLAFAGRLRGFMREWRRPEVQSYLAKLALAFFITGVGGLVLKKLGFKQQEAGEAAALRVAYVVAWTTLVGGGVILAIEGWLKKRALSSEVTWAMAALVGCAQLLAVVLPGTSRSAATILTAVLMGLQRPVAIEFSFLLGVPTLLAAGGLETYSAFKHGETVDWGLVLAGAVTSAVTAFIAVKWLLRYVQTHTFVVFGWYRIVLGVVILAVLWK